MSSLSEIQAAAARIAGHTRKTPLLSSPFLDQIAGRPIFVKPECLQHSGSFKFRGAWSAISNLSMDQRRAGVIAFSSGNHAQGVAMAAAHHNCSAIIVMPSDAPEIKRTNTQALGAEVVLYDRETEDREAVTAALNPDGARTLIAPFNNHDVIAGQGTIGLEIAVQSAELGIDSASVLIPCGGGGLTSGVALALEQHPGLTVHPVEPEGFDDVARSLVSGKPEINQRLSGSICDAILTPSPGELTFPILNRLCSEGIVIPEEDCLRAMALAFERLRIVIEPGGAIALAAALFHPDKIAGDTVIAVASGGNVGAEMFTQALKNMKA
ncbi:serine/threonine dehydratase [Amylibacter marinus]|uniref:Serine/threonine dehydratase n=1 Tax=Amylibacter marinus TaxID=1475483 RepID=A0ABQ5VQV6_9RHOB|nr:threonine/serine dehydratase [Amylibacter marinus]GLQ33730.1 serine/threonine dehydratase [Amylibacter marinus]